MLLLLPARNNAPFGVYRPQEIGRLTTGAVYQGVVIPAVSPYPRGADAFVRCWPRISGVGGEMSGLTAHFFFGEKSPGTSGLESSPKLGPRGGTIASSELNSVGAMAVNLDEIRSAAARVAASHGLDLVDIEFVGPARERILRVFLERNAQGREQLRSMVQSGVQAAEMEGLPERFTSGKLNPEQLSGITLDDCAAFSRDFGVLLDVEELVPGGDYTLEASSPGLDRRLTRPEEFQRFAGSLVKVQTFQPVRNNRHWQGRLAAGAGDFIRLDLSALRQNSKSRKTGLDTVEIALENIEKAQLIPEI